jgi:hypothetical protein
MSTPDTSVAPAACAARISIASNSTRRIIRTAGSLEATTAESPSGPSRCRRDIRCVPIAVSSSASHGKRFRTRMEMAPPHGLLRGKAARSSTVTGTPAAASVRAATAPAGPPPTTITIAPS